METVYIPRDQIDPFYRYKRIVLHPTLITKNGGSSTIKTLELETLAKNLERSLNDIVAFIKKHCNTSIFFKGEVMVIRKVIDKKELDDIVEKFVQENIICETCGNPETMLIKKGLLCRACGYQSRK